MAHYLQLNAFDLGENTIPQIPLYQMEFPHEWTVLLKGIMDGYHSPMKLTDLRAKLQMLFPQILGGYDNMLTEGQAYPWLIATEPIQEVWLERLTRNWLKNELLKKQKYESKAAEISPANLNWERYNLPIQWDNCVRYQVIPGLFTHAFCQEIRYLNLPGGVDIPLKFAQVFYGKKHECMSVPFLDNQPQFSYIIHFDVTNRGGEADRLLLNVRIGMRRFHTAPILANENSYELLNKKGTLLLGMSNPFVLTDPSLTVLSTLKFRRAKDSSALAQWVSAEEDLFFDILKENLSIDQFLASPLSYWSESGKVKGYLVHSSQVYQNEPDVKTGLGLPERTALLDLVSRTFNLKARLDFLEKVSCGGRLKHLPIKAPERTFINLELWMSPDMYKECVELLAQIHFDNSNGGRLLWPTDKPDEFILNANPEVVVALQHRDDAFLTQELDPEGLREQRVSEIKKRVTVAERDKLTLALIEIGEKKSYKKLDPKAAVRSGLAKTGRMTQFMYKLNHELNGRRRSKEDEEKSIMKTNLGIVTNAFLDLLADAGFVRANIPLIAEGEHIVVTGIIKRKVRLNSRRTNTEYLPVLLWFDGREIKVKRLGETLWLPMHKALLDFSKTRPFDNMWKESSQRFINWLEQEIESILLSTSEVPIYLFADAGLRQYWWKNLQNPIITSRDLPFTKRIIDEERLKFVRLNRTDDVPQYEIFDTNKNSSLNRYKGLFRDGEIYYSVGSKPDTIRAKLEITKYNTPREIILKQQAVEILPTGVKDQEEAAQLAQRAHLLREGNLTYARSTAQPFPLHLMKSLSKYWEAENARAIEDEDEQGNLEYDSYGNDFEEGIKSAIRRRYGQILRFKR